MVERRTSLLRQHHWRYAYFGLVLTKGRAQIIAEADIIVPTLALDSFSVASAVYPLGAGGAQPSQTGAFNFPEARPCSFSTTNNISSMPLPLTRRMSILLRSTTAFADLYSSSSSYGYRSARRGMDNRFLVAPSTQSVDLLLNYFEVMTWRGCLRMGREPLNVVLDAGTGAYVPFHISIY